MKQCKDDIQTDRIKTLTLKTNFNLLTCRMEKTKEYWTIYRNPGILAVVWFGSSPTPSPRTVSKLDRRHREILRKRDNLLKEEGGVDGGRSQITQQRESQVFYKSFTTLWRRLELFEICRRCTSPAPPPLERQRTGRWRGSPFHPLPSPIHPSPTPFHPSPLFPQDFQDPASSTPRPPVSPLVLLSWNKK